MGAWRALLVLVLALATAASAAGIAEAGVRLWAGRGALLYDAESVLQLNEATRRDKDVGWRVTAALSVRAAACAHHDEVLLHLQVRDPVLWLRGADRSAEWMSRGAPWTMSQPDVYGHWRAGRLLAVYLPTADPQPVADYKRALLSLFQLQLLDGERNETDVSGDCDVLYETLSPLEFRKIKRHCRWAGGEDVPAVESRRVTRYSLRAAKDALEAVRADEVHYLRALAAADHDAGVKARSWTEVKLRSAEAGASCARAEPGLQAELRALPAAFARADLAPAASDTPDTPEEEEEWDEWKDEDEDSDEGATATATQQARWMRWAAAVGSEEGGAGGGVAAARAVLRLRRALCALTPAALQALLHAAADTAQLVSLSRALGWCGNAAAHAAMEGTLRAAGGGGGGGGATLQAALAYLAALSTARRPDEAAIKGALKLSSSESLRGAALLAAAGGARGGHALAAHVKDELAKMMARCKDTECVSTVATAVGNLGRRDTAELLLGAAERHPAAALHALRALTPAPTQIGRLSSLSLNSSLPLSVRGAALELAAAAAVHHPYALAHLARHLHKDNTTHELRRVFWQRMEVLAEEHEAVRQFLEAVAADPELGSWDARAHAGTSHVCVRGAGWQWGGYSAVVDSSQLAAGGALRRGVVTLRLKGAAEGEGEVLRLELLTTGLAAAGAAGAGGGDDDEPMSAQLLLSVAGAALPAITLFSSQSELVGHVWAGTGSTDTGVVRGAVPLDAAGPVSLVSLSCGARVRLRGGAAAALALDARGAASLWSRTAAAAVTLRAAVAADASATVIGGVAGSVAVRSAAAAAGALAVSAELDLYDAAALCVRADVAPHSLTQRAAMRSTLGPRSWRVRRQLSRVTRREGRQLTLPRQAQAACTASAGDTD